MMQRFLDQAMFFSTVKNKSEEKLRNSSFLQLENSPTKLKKKTTEQQQKNLAIRYILLVGINLWIFQCCKKIYLHLLHVEIVKKTSCLQILTDTNKKKYGLAENYLIKCSNCKHGKSCYTSKRTVKAERQVIMM